MEKGKGLLPEADLDIELEYKNESRLVRIVANSHYGETLVEQLELS